MKKPRRLIETGKIFRHALEDGSTNDAVSWLRKHQEIPKQQCTCDEGGPSCGYQEKDEQDIEKISIYGPDHPLFYS